MKTKKIAILYGVVGIIGLVLILQHILAFTPHDYFYIQNPNIEKYVGVNVVSAWADMSFFTYHTLIFFSIWSILYFVSVVFKVDRLYNFLYKRWIICFVFTNYVITVLIYSLFEILSPTNLGLYNINEPMAWHNFGTNILVHYVIFIFAFILYVKSETNGNITTKEIIINVTYLVIYYLVVKLTGMFCYQIEWYPYPIFDAGSMSLLFGLGGSKPFVGVILLIVSNMAILALYLSLLIGFSKIKSKQILNKKTDK